MRTQHTAYFHSILTMVNFNSRAVNQTNLTFCPHHDQNRSHTRQHVWTIPEEVIQYHVPLRIKLSEGRILELEIYSMAVKVLSNIRHVVIKPGYLVSNQLTPSPA